MPTQHGNEDQNDRIRTLHLEADQARREHQTGRHIAMLQSPRKRALPIALTRQKTGYLVRGKTRVRIRGRLIQRRSAAKRKQNEIPGIRARWLSGIGEQLERISSKVFASLPSEHEAAPAYRDIKKAKIGRAHV